MKVGDLVLPRDDWKTKGLDYGIGIILDTYDDDDGMEYYEVKWEHEIQWWRGYEMILFNES